MLQAVAMARPDRTKSVDHLKSPTDKAQFDEIRDIRRGDPWRRKRRHRRYRSSQTRWHVGRDDRVARSRRTCPNRGCTPKKVLVAASHALHEIERLEFGHIYAPAGADVTILEALPQLLPAMDADEVARIQTESERIGIRVGTNVTVKRIEPANNRLRLIFTYDGNEHAAEADRIVNGAGRVANVDTLNLAVGNVKHSNGRVAVDRHLRSISNPAVYVCGDAVPISPQLSPIATYEGDIVGRNIVEGPNYSPDYGSMATSVYTVPALAAVGLTEAAANQKGFAIRVHANDMHDWFSARTYAETVAWSKIIVDQATDRILGAHFVGHAGQELVNIFGLAMRFGITATQNKDYVYAYPTFSSDIKHML
jgi:glutathione reductase (NADPH)